MKSFFSVVFFLFLLVFFSNCKTDKEQDNKDKLLKQITLAYLGTASSPADNYSRIFYLDPLYLTSRKYDLFPLAASSHVNSSKKKIIIVHGWQPKDRDSNSNPSEQYLKERIIETIWKDVFSSEFLGQVLSKGYDIFFYTYLTSSRIDRNGSRFRNALDSLFLNQPKNIYIYAHSMGGLIAKSAINIGEEPSYISRIYTSGTPYHGSPWASSAFQSNNIILGDLATYLTDTEGGRQLAWDNFDNSLSGASNSFLDELNKNTSRSHLFFGYYGSLDPNGTGYTGTDPLLLPGCTTLGAKFSPSDCMVPVSSAIGTNLGLSRTTNLGSLNHTDINLKVSSVRDRILLDLD